MKYRMKYRHTLFFAAPKGYQGAYRHDELNSERTN